MTDEQKAKCHEIADHYFMDMNAEECDCYAEEKRKNKCLTLD